MINKINLNQIDLYKSDSISDNYHTYISKHNIEDIYFFGKKCNAIYVGTDKNNIITSFFLSTKRIIDENLFTLLTEKYGQPKELIKKGTTIYTQSNFEEDYISRSETAETLNCTFNEKPDFINWIKKNYVININFDYIRGTSMISFKINF